jgi:hypothetical protein
MRSFQKADLSEFKRDFPYLGDITDEKKLQP